MDLDLEEDIRQDLVSFKLGFQYQPDKWESIFDPCQPVVGMSDVLFKRTNALTTSSKGTASDDLNKIMRDLNLQWKDICPKRAELFTQDEHPDGRDMKEEIWTNLKARYMEWQRVVIYRRHSLLLAGLGSKFDLAEDFVAKHIVPFKSVFTMAPFHIHFEPRRALTNLLWFIQKGTKKAPLNMKLIPWDTGRILQDFEVALAERQTSVVLVIHSIDRPVMRPIVQKIILPLTTKGLLLIGTMDDVRAPIDLMLWNTWQYPIVIQDDVHTHELFVKEMMAEHWIYNKEAKSDFKYEPDDKSLESQLLYDLCVGSKATNICPSKKAEPILPIPMSLPEMSDMLSYEEYVTVAQNLGQRYREVLVVILNEFDKSQRSTRTSRRSLQMTVTELKLASSQIRFKSKLIQERLLKEKAGKISVCLARGDIPRVLEALGSTGKN